MEQGEDKVAEEAISFFLPEGMELPVLNHPAMEELKKTVAGLVESGFLASPENAEFFGALLPSVAAGINKLKEKLDDDKKVDHKAALQRARDYLDKVTSLNEREHDLSQVLNILEEKCDQLLLDLLEEPTSVTQERIFLFIRHCSSKGISTALTKLLSQLVKSSNKDTKDLFVYLSTCMARYHS